MRVAIAATTCIALLMVAGLDALLATVLPRLVVHGLAGLASLVVLVLAGLAVQAAGRRGA